MTIGNRIVALRKSKNFSQEYLAERMEVSRQAVSKWENDLSTPDMQNLIRLAELFGVSVEYLASGGAAAKPEGGEVGEKLSKVLRRIAGVLFVLGLVCHCGGLFSGVFTRCLIPVFPYLWYGTSVWAILLNALTALFTVTWICLLAACAMLRRKS